MERYGVQRCPICATPFNPLRPYEPTDLLVQGGLWVRVELLSGAARRGACSRRHALAVRRLRAAHRREVLAHERQQERQQEREQALAAGLERDGQLALEVTP